MGRFRTMLSRLVLALPFVIGAAAARSAVAPIGDALAQQASVVAALLSAPRTGGMPVARRDDDDEGFAEASPSLASGPSAVLGQAKRERRPKPMTGAPPRGNVGNEAAAAVTVPLASRSAGTIAIPAAVVERAMQRKDVGAANATAPDGTPLGARLRGVGKYRTGLRDGDVVVMVEGVATPNVEAMVMQAMRAASAGATRLTGRIRRGDATYDVVLELPPR